MALEASQSVAGVLVDSSPTRNSLMEEAAYRSRGHEGPAPGGGDFGEGRSYQSLNSQSQSGELHSAERA